MRTCPFCSAPVDDHATVCFSCARELPQARERGASRLCPECGRRVRQDADYCHRCGHAFRPGLALECDHCGRDNAPDARYCSQCGQPLGEELASATCVVCQRPLPAQALFCPACGSSQVARPSRRCPTCQRDIPRQSVYCPYCRTATSRPASNRYEEAAAALPAAPAAPARPDLSWLWAGLVFIAGVALALFLLLGDVFRPQTVAPAPLLAVNTAKGSITVGAPAYIDGSGLDVWEPITLASIPVWDLAPGQHVVCDLPHGTPVQVLEIRLVPSEHRHYFRVLTEGCEGWVPELALGSVRRALPGQQS